jgi:hypothetical protein
MFASFACINITCAHRSCRSAFAGAFVDNEFETHGVCRFQILSNQALLTIRFNKQLDFIDKEKAKYQGAY